MRFGPALLLALAVPILGLQAAAQPPSQPEPYRTTSEQPLDFRGPGRDAPEPAVAEVAIGWFGPGDPDHPEFGESWRGATLALEEEDAAGGYRGKPFRLLPAWSESPWKAGILEVTRLVYERGAWAVIGGVDGTTTHLAVQLALKSFFPLLSPGSTDVTADDANVPWLFSLPPSDERLAGVVADGVASTSAGGPFTMLAGTDHDSHAALVAVRRGLRERRLEPARLVELPQAEPNLAALARQAIEGQPRAVVVVARSTVAGRLVSELRRTGYRGTVLGGATLGGAAFARAAAGAADGVLAPCWAATDTVGWRTFASAYRRRFGGEPDIASAQGYDAVRLLAAAVRSGGLNRARIRDALRAASGWQGAAGIVRWNALGRNEPSVRLGVWRGGSLHDAPRLVSSTPARVEPSSPPAR